MSLSLLDHPSPLRPSGKKRDCPVARNTAGHRRSRVGQSPQTESTTLRLWLWKTLRNGPSDPTLDELSQRPTRDSSRERREPDRGLDRALDGRPHRRRPRAPHADRVSARPVAPHRDAHARAAQACASNAPAPQGPHGMVGVEPPQRARAHLVRGIFPLQSKLIPSREAQFDRDAAR